MRMPEQVEEHLWAYCCSNTPAEGLGFVFADQASMTARPACYTSWQQEASRSDHQGFDHRRSLEPSVPAVVTLLAAAPAVQGTLLEFHSSFLMMTWMEDCKALECKEMAVDHILRRHLPALHPMGWVCIQYYY